MATHAFCTHRPTKMRRVDPDTSPLLHALSEDGWWYDYEGWDVERPCEFGACHTVWCPVCGIYKGGWGPVGCPCDGYPVLPEQRPRPRGFDGLKPSIRKRRRGRRN